MWVAGSPARKSREIETAADVLSPASFEAGYIDRLGAERAAQRAVHDQFFVSTGKCRADLRVGGAE